MRIILKAPDGEHRIDVPEGRGRGLLSDWIVEWLSAQPAQPESVPVVLTVEIWP